MARQVRLRELLVGVEGLALLRGLFTGTDEAAQRRIDEVRRILADPGDGTYAAATDAPALDVADGYARWSTTYDEPGNPLISVEQRVVWPLLDTIAPGRALDAACGTGRHAGHLVARGHDVTGIDATPEMLARARAEVPAARFEVGDLGDLPLEDASVDLAVCALALDHVDDLAPPIAEVARVVRAGGRVIVSDIHPVLTVLGGVAFFRAADGTTGYVRGYQHAHADYLDAFAAAGLQVRRCLEPGFGAAEVEMQRRSVEFAPEAAEAAYLDLPAALVCDLVRGG